ncbi:MAG: CAP domain-containing protein [Zavarzinella sp.]
MAGMQTILQIELLESRDCPATVDFTNGYLTVLGNSESESITLTRDGIDVVVEGQRFNLSSIRMIVISAGSGNDTITVDSAITNPTTIYGGFGDDIIFGGNGSNTIFGGYGNDTIFGGNGYDRIIGGGGTDTINGGGGRNVLIQNQASFRGILRVNTSMEQQVIDQVNLERTNAGLNALTTNFQLNGAAYIHSDNMARLSATLGFGALSHTLTQTISPETSNRLDIVGYTNFNTRFSYGENLAVGYPTVAEAVAAWMDSPGHRANILNPNFLETGVSITTDSSGQFYITQVFGERL